MILYPAIDLKDGVCVRLMHGRFDAVTRYDDVPAARLVSFVGEGAAWVHVVDLDGAEAGAARQHALIGELAGSVDIQHPERRRRAVHRRRAACCWRPGSPGW